MRRGKAVEFARKMGYDGAKYRGKWKGNDVYEPINDEEQKGSETSNVRDWELILDNGIAMLMVVEDAAYEVLNSLPWADEE